MSKNGRKEKVAQVLFSAEANSASALEKEQLGKYSDIAVSMFHTQVLAFREILIPSIGEFAGKIADVVWGYRDLYYTLALHIDLTYLIVVKALISIYNVLNDPIMGMVYDKTRTRWGKARPWIMLGAAPYYLSSVLLFSGAFLFGNDTTKNDPKKILFVFAVLFLQETFSTLYQIPRSNMTTLMSPNPKDRKAVGLLNYYASEFAGGIIAVLFEPAFEGINKGYLKFPIGNLYMGLAVFSAFIGISGNISMAIKCRERLLLQPKPAPITKTMFYVLKNKYRLRNFIAGFFSGWLNVDGSYRWDVITHQEIFGGAIPSFLAELPKNILNTVSASFYPYFNKVFKGNNRNAVIVLRMWDMVCLFLECLICIPMIKPPWRQNRWKMIAVFAILYGINAVNNGPSQVFEQELNREIDDYTEYVTGERPDGTIGILTGLLSKVTEPLNTLLSVFIIKWLNYDISITSKLFSQGNRQVYQKIFFIYRGFDLLPKIIQMIPYFFYDLVGEKREQMYVAINERRALLASDANKNPAETPDEAL